jgi:hypothetical protein
VLTTLLDLLGLALIAGFSFFLWPYLPLLVVGVAALYISRRRS